MGGKKRGRGGGGGGGGGESPECLRICPAAVTYNAGTAHGVGLGGSRYTQISVSPALSKIPLEEIQHWYTNTTT